MAQQPPIKNARATCSAASSRASRRRRARSVVARERCRERRRVAGSEGAIIKRRQRGSVARERAQCSTTAAQGIGGAIEVECRIGVACEKGAGLGSATAAAKRFVAGKKRLRRGRHRRLLGFLSWGK